MKPHGLVVIISHVPPRLRPFRMFSLRVISFLNIVYGNFVHFKLSERRKEKKKKELRLQRPKLFCGHTINTSRVKTQRHLHHMWAFRWLLLLHFYLFPFSRKKTGSSFESEIEISIRKQKINKKKVSGVKN